MGKSPGLLVLDNFEQIAEDGVVSATLLERAPALRCLVTPRAAERRRGTAVRPSAASDPETEGDINHGVEYPSVQLFVDRARKARADFELTDTNAADVAALCRTLEGIPLALELAAAWAGTLTTSQIRIAYPAGSSC